MAQLADKTVHTPAGDAPLIPVLIMAGGAYLCWFGVHYWRSDVTWPTDPIKAVLTGKPLPDPTYASYQKAASDLVTASPSGTGTPTAGEPGTPGVSGLAGKYVLSYNQVKQLWTTSGGSQQTASIAAAIAYAESSGIEGATSPNPDGGTNVGLWQLDTKGVGAGYSVEQLKDPDTNARVTVLHTANGTNWNAWETWHTGAYKKFLNPANPDSVGA